MEMKQRQEKREVSIIRESIVSPSFLINNNPPGHALDDLCIKLDGVIPGEADFLGQVVGQNVDQIPISVGIQ
jgi:hypothetical protein